jgi:predicted metalloprotease with PDZ domain
LGIVTKAAGGRTQVKHVFAGSPAADAGINPGDELLAVDGIRVDPSSWQAQLALKVEGAQVDVLVSRRKRLVPLKAQLAKAPFDSFKVKGSGEITQDQREILEAWFQRPWS